MPMILNRGFINANFYITVGFYTPCTFRKMVFQKCCCCINLRIGAIIIATLDIIRGLVKLGFGTGTLPAMDDWSVWFPWFAEGSSACLLMGIACVYNGTFLLYGAIKYH